MLKIDLDGIDSYKDSVTKAIDYLTSAKEKLTLAATKMNNRGIGSDALSVHNSSYNYDAMERKRENIVSSINAKVTKIDEVISSLDSINLLCDLFISDVEADTDSITSILGVYADPNFNVIETEDFVRTNDILTFDPMNCDYYINKDKVKIYFQIPNNNDKQQEEKYKIRDVGNHSYVKLLYHCHNKNELSNENDYSVILCKINNDYRIGYVKNNDISMINKDSNGKLLSPSNLEDSFDQSGGYGIVSNKGENLTVRPYPNSDQGSYTDSIHSSGHTYVTEIPDGTVVKIEGYWRNEEQDDRLSYLVSFSNGNGNFMGFVDGKKLKTGRNGISFDSVNDVLPVKANKDTNLYCIDGVTRVAKTGTVLNYQSEIDDAYLCEYRDETGNVGVAWINKNDSERIIPDSLSKMNNLD